MPAPAIKICGINTPEALAAALSVQAEHVGLVHFPRSPRHLALAEAAALSAQAQGRINRVGLFVDPDDDLLTQVLAAVQIDTLQLHGKETPEHVAQIKARFGVPVWKALAITSRDDVIRSAAYAGAADLLLFDAKTPDGALPGGMGLAFDWSLLAGYRGALPWGIAGGLSPANVATAVRTTGTTLVDTSSGVESAPGIKDAALIRDFCAAARAA